MNTRRAVNDLAQYRRRRLPRQLHPEGNSMCADHQTLWEAARTVLMFDGFIEPDLAAHLAHRIEANIPYLLDMSRFSGAQCLVGNTLIEHRPLSRMTACHWTVRRWLKRILYRDPEQVCLCGWNSRETLFEYHQADMVNAAVAAYVDEMRTVWESDRA